MWLGYELDNWGSITGISRDIFFATKARQDSGVHPASYPCTPGTLSLGAEQVGCEADHLPPVSA
jgi:hypothetical protein